MVKDIKRDLLKKKKSRLEERMQKVRELLDKRDPDSADVRKLREVRSDPADTTS